MSLLVFDDSISIQGMNRVSLKGENSIILFPLTGKQHILNQVVNKCYAESIKKVEIIKTSQIIDEIVDRIRDKYLEFIAELPDKFRIDGQNLKEWLYYPESGISLWWLSLVAEKNTFKSDNFNRLVQLYAVIKVAEEHGVKKIVLSCGSRKLQSTISLYCRQNSLAFILLPNAKERGIRKLQDKHPAINAIIGAGLCLSNYLLRWICIKLFLRKNLKNRINTAINNPLLIVTYYPNIDIGFASKGIFKNKYCLSLQEELEKQRRSIIWVAMYANNTRISFRESVRYAKKFIANGYHFAFMEEFLSTGSFIKILRGLLWSLIKFRKIEKKLSEYHCFDRAVPIYPILRKDWYLSFCGAGSVESFLFLEAFSNMYGNLKGLRKGVYFCEMHAWEKALSAAKKMHADDTELFGYQHATVSRMLLNYFNCPSELVESDSRYAMPRPDKMACDGEIPYGYFRESGWREEDLTIVEAIRYSHLSNVAQYGNKISNVIMVAFSINIEESSAILSVVYEGLKDVGNIKVWLKPHPFLPMDLVLKESGISLGDAQFEIKEGQIEKLLPDVKVVIISQSGVALEAMAYGCKIISINLPDMVNMSPLRGVKSNWIRHVNSADELREEVYELLKKNEGNNMEDIKELVNQFFYLGKTQNKPERFLALVS